MSSSKALRDLRKSIKGVKGDANIFAIPVSSSPAKQINFSSLHDNKDKQKNVESFMKRNMKKDIQATEKLS